MSDILNKKAIEIYDSIVNKSEASLEAGNFLRQMAHLKSIAVVQKGIRAAEFETELTMQEPCSKFFGVKLFLDARKRKCLILEPSSSSASNKKLSAQLWIGEDRIRWNPRDGKQAGPNGKINTLIDFTPEAVEEMVRVAYSIKRPIMEDSVIYSGE